MAKTVLNLIMTFDGYVAGLHDEIDWIGSASQADSGESAKWDFSEFTSKVGAIIVGRRSYELGIKLGWFKDNAYGPSPIFVLSKDTPAEISDDAEFNFVDSIDDIYAQASEAAGQKWIYLFGGPSVFQQFLNKDLVDELYITIAPILLGKGIRLFENLDERQLRLEKIEATVHPNGMIETKYRIAR